MFKILTQINLKITLDNQSKTKENMLKHKFEKHSLCDVFTIKSISFMVDNQNRLSTIIQKDNAKNKT